MSVTVDLATFRVWFPEFNQSNDTLVTRFLGDALDIHGANPRATLYCTAHLMALDSLEKGKPDLGLGELTAEHEGPLIAQFKTQASKDREVFFTTTTYGRRFLEVEKRTPAFVIAGGFF